MTKHSPIAQGRQKIPHEVIIRAPGLLPMMYKTRELAEDLGINQQTIIRWAQNGAPHDRDGKGHIWIHGHLFASWVDSQRKPSSRKDFPLDHGYCFRCKEMVKMEDITKRRITNLIMLTGACFKCGGTVNRGSSDG